MKRLSTVAMFVAVIAAFPAASLAKWERQWICPGPSNGFISVGALDAKRAAASGAKDEGSGNTAPVVYYTDDGNRWDPGDFEVREDAMMTMALYMSAPSAKTSFMGVMSFGASSSPDIESSKNGGAWSFVTESAPKEFDGATLAGVHFSDYLNGSMLGNAKNANWFVHTSDGAKTWKKYTITHETDIQYQALFFLNDKVGWIAGGDYGETDEKGNIIRPTGSGVIQYTLNGGGTWNKSVSGKPYVFTAINFSDCSHGWAAATDNWKTGHILVTADGGKNWTEQTIPKHSGGKDIGYFTAIRFFDSSEGWALGNVDESTEQSEQYEVGILHTMNGGKTWVQDTAYNDAAKADTGAPCCLPSPDACKGVIVTMAGQFSSANSMDWPERNTGYVVGSNGIVMKYTADTPAPGPAPRCVECMGKCYKEPEDKDAGSPDSGAADGGADGAGIDGGEAEDSGPPDAGPAHILPAADGQLCLSGAPAYNPFAFDMVVALGTRRVTGEIDAFILPGSSNITLGQALGAARSGAQGTTPYLHFVSTMSYKPQSLAVQVGAEGAFALYTASSIAASISEKDRLLSVGGIAAGLVDGAEASGGSLAGWMRIPILADKDVNIYSGYTLEQLFNFVRRPCEEPDGGVPGEDGGADPADGSSQKDSGPINDGGGAGAGCSCSVAAADGGGAPVFFGIGLLLAGIALAVAAARKRS